MVVLTCIKSESCHYNPFVVNRVTEILEHTAPEDWNYVGLKSNPADDITKGLILASLTASSSLNYGPSFLQKSKDLWPVTYPETTTKLEMRKQFCGNTINDSLSQTPNFTKYSIGTDLV